MTDETRRTVPETGLMGKPHTALMREHADYMASYNEPFVGSTDAIARALRTGADRIDQLERELAERTALLLKTQGDLIERNHELFVARSATQPNIDAAVDALLEIDTTFSVQEARAAVEAIIRAAGVRSTTGLSGGADAKDAERWRALRGLAGYYQDGSQTTVMLYQDDATRSCFIRVGDKSYGGDGTNFEAALDSALSATGERK